MELSCSKFKWLDCLDNTRFMIYIKDNFLPKNMLSAIKNNTKEYKEIKTPGKSFWTKKPSEIFVQYVVNRLAEVEDCDIENILCFFRQAKENQDNNWRIHNDSIIQGQQPDRALVLFLSDENYNGLNGTAFWEHKERGDTYKVTDNNDFDELLTKDCNDISKWNLKTVIGHKTNRLVSYPCEYFHSKYPNEFKEKREVLVMFYKTKK